MKKLFAIILTAALLLTVIPVGTFSVFAAENTTEFAGGDGTAEKPYLISTKEHLNNVRFYLSSNFKMIKDIVFDEKDFQEGGDYYNDGNGWEPIGFTTDIFTGTFDGNNHSISNLVLSYKGTNSIGFFGNVKNATIENLCICAADIMGEDSTGGIIGKMTSSIVRRCCFNGSVGGNNKVGGICGEALEESIILQCNVQGKISGSENIGGICGYIAPYNKENTEVNLIIEKCYNIGDITGEKYVGGIIGCSYTSYAKSTTFVEGKYGGASYYRIDWTAPKRVNIENCYNNGKIESGNYCSGIIGRAICQKDTTSSSYNIGNYYTNVAYCYNSGVIKCENSTKSAICINSSTSETPSGIICDKTTVLYLSKSSGNDDDSYGTVKTSNQMRSQGSFTDWDFNTVWTMGGDKNYLYPELQCFTLRGKPIINGNVSYDSTVTADLSNIETVNDTIKYLWSVGGATLSDTNSYKIKAEDIGKKLKLEVISTHPLCGGSVYSDEITVSKAAQPTSPAIPELISKDDKSFEISTVSTQEYSTDNKNWQASGKFNNLAPNKEYTVYSRILENNLYFTSESKEVLKVTTDRRPLSGTVAIVGTSRYGDTLSADVSAVLPANATYSYEWKSGGAVVGTNSTYTVVKNDIGNVITVSVKGTKNFIGTVTSAGVTATKTTVQTPAAPTVSDKTNVTVTLTEKSGYEYSKDKANWQDSTVFTGLSAATEYTFYQRIKATETTFASSASNGTKVTTLKNSILAPASPTVVSKTNTSITLKAKSGYEYSKDGLTWQKSNIFTGLNPNTEYSFCQRIAENETDYASATSEFTSVVTLKNSIVAPSAPTVKTATANSVTLNAISGYEYSKDGTTWQKSNTFNGLTLFNAYNFYQRIAETDTDYASPASKALPFKVKNLVSKPNKPTLKEKTNSKIEVIGTQGYEYSIDGKNWVINTVFTGLNPNQTYSVYCRIPETDTEYVSDASDALTVTTLKNTVSKPSAPTTSSVKDTSVTLTANSNYEFSKDGITWQKNNTFTGLSPNKEYTFYQRIAETNTAYASEKSGGKKVTTLKSTVNTPAAPTLVSKTDVSITLTQKAGYEYSKDGTTWQKDNVFTGLSANTEYTFYQRIAETDTTYASSKSDALKVTTLKHTQATTPTAPTVKKAFATSVILYHTEGYEYSKNGTTWQKDNVFTGLSANTEYTFYQRIAETNTTYASAKSSVLKVKTAEKATCSITPIKPIITGYTSSSVTLYSLDGYEYSKNGTSWQSSATFNGLSANTTYTFYQRIKETTEEKASDKSVGVSVKIAKSTGGSTVEDNFDKVLNYINTYGDYNTSDGCKYIYSDNSAFAIAMAKKGSNLYFCLGIKSYTSERIDDLLECTLSKSSKYMSCNFTELYYKSNKLYDGVDGSVEIDRTTYDINAIYSISRNKENSVFTASAFKDAFNAELGIMMLTIDSELMYGKLGFGLEGLGFHCMNSRPCKVCDHLAGYHYNNNSDIRGKYDASCTIPGYTGDVYCTTCGEKISSGTTIPCTGHHTFDNSCDDTCNVCGEMRYIEHTYSSDCDCECDICHTRRVAPKEHDFGDGDTCKNCGSGKYTPGDLDGEEGITDSDAIYLLMHTFFPEDYPVDQPLDFNGDGFVTDADAIYLLMYTFFLEDYPI